MLRFRFGRHDESDIIDTLQEYFYDWGAFGHHLYHNYQDLFPWDCTEAYGRYPVKCNECNIAKHVWSFPFDSWSLIHLHLQKDRRLYVPTNPGVMRSLSDEDWMRNRLQILVGQEALLTGAVAMARSTTLPKDTRWISMQRDPMKDRLKLGGIRRAQPFSHHFEQGRYHEYLIAAWAHLNRPQQIAAYELLRDGRVQLPDVPKVPHISKSQVPYIGKLRHPTQGTTAVDRADRLRTSQVPGLDFTDGTFDRANDCFLDIVIDASLEAPLDMAWRTVAH